MSPFAKQLHSYYTSFGSSLAREALSNFLKGKRVFFLGYSREISSLLSFMGGAGIHFGGPARGEDYGDTWVYLEEVEEQDGRLVFQSQTKDFKAGVAHERGRVLAILRAFWGLPGVGEPRACVRILADLIEKGEEGVDAGSKQG